MKLIWVLIALFFSNSASAKRYIIGANENGQLTDEIKIQGFSIIRHMESVPDTFVTDIPPETADLLKEKFPEITITPDLVMTIVRNKSLPVDAIESTVQTFPWGIKAIDAQYAHSFNKGAGVKVCIVDSGVDKKHADLAGNISGGRNFVAVGGKVIPEAWGDDNGHGTHVAGIIAARDNNLGVLGVAPAAKLFAVKVIGKDGTGYLSDVADGVLSCIRSGSRVINMSLGAAADPTQDSPLKRAVEAAIKKGLIVVVAAGNEGQNIANTIPAGYKNTIAVAASDSGGAIPAWSNSGLGTGDMTAPGVAIYSTWPGDKYATLDGTSMAAPHVSGVVALSLSSGTKRITAVDMGLPRSKQGEGLVNALMTVAK